MKGLKPLHRLNNPISKDIIIVASVPDVLTASALPDLAATIDGRDKVFAQVSTGLSLQLKRIQA